MKKQEEAKTAIFNAAMELIHASEGNVDEITTRMIAEKAGVGVGLINYHFQTKDRLIEGCVQTIIHHVTGNFKPGLIKNLSSQERLSAVMKQVADFLMENQAVSRISVLGDFAKPEPTDNTMRTVEGFCKTMDLPEGESFIKEKIAMFALTTTLQAAFLRKNSTLVTFGFNFEIKEERDRFIDLLVEQIARGNNNEQ
ncbi:hypothetical protein A7K91_18665 [Paenibacillus oryzae]|uniref:HTH tetR-type domain-containing protein n=1 Tax=Paenibacillus oryzae TaxID=1844972 RepID=A0A1A5YQR0_9BACL|nr:TetR/AcrR family transcriptional regulator [Paenibacillus oryzae]OBR67956.1 hypothetical protein A7K91_18665 [Paenibacillus oryzae]